MSSIRQRNGEEELEYLKRMNDAVSICGSVQDPEEIVTMFMGGFDPTI